MLLPKCFKTKLQEMSNFHMDGNTADGTGLPPKLDRISNI